MLNFFAPALIFLFQEESRGGLMLRCVDSGLELDYVPVAGAIRPGKRPPKLAPR